MLLAIVAGTAPRCFSQTLTVRAIDVKSLKPIKGKVIRLQFEDFPPLQLRKGYVDQATDKNGRAAFNLPTPLPARVIVNIEFANWRQCSPALADYDTSQVLRSGVVADDLCTYDASQSLSAKPGEIVIFARYVSFWDRLRNFPV
jgi:hypothetical protein